MSVFILEFQDYDDFQIIGVFSSMEKAMIEKDGFLNKNPKYDENNVLITEHEIK